MPTQPVTALSLADVARLVGGEVHGDPAHPVLAVSGLDGLTPGAMTFAESARAVREAEGSAAGSLLAPPGTESRLPTVRVANPRVAFARLLEHFHPPSLAPRGVHPSASVDPTATVAPDSHVGPFAVVGAGSRIEPGCEVRARAVVGVGCRLGAGSRLLPGAVLGDGCTVGRDSLIGALTSLAAGTVVGDDVEIGARCRLDRCRVDRGCRLDNMVRVGEEAHLGEHAIMVSQTVLGPGARLGRYCIVAAHGLVLPGVSVGDAAQVAGRARVVADLPAGQAAWAGDPAVPHRDELRREARRGRALEAWYRLRGLRRQP